MTAGAALLRDNCVIAEFTLNDKKTHSQTLLPMIDEIVKFTGINMRELDAIAISAGPGSYTGLRIGSATAKGFGLALNIPLIEVSTLEAMACVCRGYSGLVCPVIDARREQVYTGVWKAGESSGASGMPEDTLSRPLCLLEPELLTLTELGEKLKEILEKQNIADPVLFTGDAAAHAVSVLGPAVPCRKAAPTHLYPRAAAVAALGAAMAKAGELVGAAEHRPVYLRKTQAERQRDAGIYTKGSIIPGEGKIAEACPGGEKGEADV